jgi:hypothetical protein
MAMPRLQEGQRAVGAILPEQRMRNRLQCTVIRKGHSMTTTAQIAGEDMTKDQIRDIFMAHGFTIKEGQTDLKPYVYDAARALLASKPAVPEGWKLAMVERSYDMRVKAIIAFNTAEQSGKDRDDALDAAWQAMLAASPTAPAQLGQWVHCSPALLKAGIRCANTPRRACACEPESGGHDHFIAHIADPAEQADEAVTK